MARDNSSTEDETGPKQAVDDLAVGDRVTVCIPGRLTEIYEDGSGKLDASGMEIPFWPDELCGVETGTESETEAGIEADDDSENADPRLIISEETEGTQETDNSETATGPEAGSVAPDPIDMATEIVEVLEDGNRRRAQLLADRLSETLIEEQAAGLEASNALQEAMAEMVESTEGLDEDAVDALEESGQPPRITPTEWAEGGIHLDRAPLRLARELREITGLFRITIEPENVEGHHWRMRFEDVDPLYSRPTDERV